MSNYVEKVPVLIMLLFGMDLDSSVLSRYYASVQLELHIHTHFHNQAVTDKLHYYWDDNIVQSIEDNCEILKRMKATSLH
ncbi:unnamed protein product [Ambrosiozyma monospora]|uniref:Unnamed protein product n=1 Tax=Ambrosiozyma monospora TaxID=43982 RepID=A0A9W6YXI2_AMBMO|nr:unnamed protein product [Ambrosiozyma monospora]